MWNRSIRLQKKESRQQDREGFVKGGGTYTESIPANFTDTTRNDEILAAQKGYTADQNVEIMACNYHGEEYLLDESNGALYEVKRTYRKDKSMLMILTCERRAYGAV